MPVTDRGLIKLERVRRIEKLDLRGTNVTDDGIARLRAVFPAAWIVGPGSRF
jgi:hypothetical protein